MAVHGFYEIFLDLEWYLDDGLYLDSTYDDTIIVETEVYIPRISVTEVLDTEVITLVYAYDSPVRAVDILPLIPSKFHTSDLLTQYIEVINLFLGRWLGKIDIILELVDVYRAGLQYLPLLADIINLETFIEDETTTQELRNQIARAVGWYKIKGTYESVRIAMHSLDLKVNIYDLYTDDYANFIETLWSVENEGENPPPVSDGSDLGSAYYKSPHFVLEILLVRLFDSELWNEGLYNKITEKILKVIPLYTVPHYRVSLNCVTDGSGDVYTTDYDVKTKIWGTWDYTQLYLDMDYIPVSSDSALSSGATRLWYLDDGKYLDQSEDAFLQSITIWKIGTGNKGVSPDDSGFSGPVNIVEIGTIDEIQILEDRVNWIFTIASDTSLSGGLSELGLYNIIDELKIVSTFPDIDKISEYELKVTVTLLR